MKIYIFLVVLFAFSSQRAFSQTKTSNSFASIRMKIDSASVKDTMILFYYDNIVASRPTPKMKIQSILNTAGVYSFKLSNIASHGYLSIYKKGNENSKGLPRLMIDTYLIKQGDDVMITANKRNKGYRREINMGYLSSYRSLLYDNRPIYNLSFTGNGSLKYNLKFRIDTTILQKSNFIGEVDAKGVFINNEFYDQSRAISQQILSEHHSNLKDDVYYQLLADYLGILEFERLNNWANLSALRGTDPPLRLRASFSSYNDKLKANQTNIPGEYLTRSAYYAKSIAMYYYHFSSMSERFNIKDLSIGSTKEALEQIKVKYNGKLRDKILTFFLSRSNRLLGDQKLMASAKSVMKDPDCLKELKSLGIGNEKGSLAYNFKLVNEDDKIVQLSDFKNKVVFIDFWYTGCGNCVIYYQNVLKEIEHKYKDRKDIVFITVNIDKKKEQWIKSIDEGLYTTSEAINLNTGGVGINHDIISYYRVNAYPRPMLIGRDGRVFNNSPSDLKNGVIGLSKILDEALAK
ncbi:thiol-disulfide isomerase/thioredoxin [Pedobacter sp. AK017]|uniref:TlpA family protein disulfide reductase n=1 Tax=Pedobacter sp. AK017 TaxID=2723073 RepID=UPI0016087BD0|nr:TlpA disulfide reductase family protein [Pedobacter sp. AK017]MBB5437337.1 thiol-disulfide isomerase/thioredoxin [Pedobacter sp. AK017]